jgi:hypothetical protein
MMIRLQHFANPVLLNAQPAQILLLVIFAKEIGLGVNAIAKMVFSMITCQHFVNPASFNVQHAKMP